MSHHFKNKIAEKLSPNPPLLVDIVLIKVVNKRNPLSAQRPTRALIDLKALEYNYASIKEKLPEGTSMLAIVKANAYGHGAVVVAKRLEALNCEFLGVAICEEGIELRRAGISKPILILGGLFRNQIESVIDFDLTPLVFDLKSAILISRYGEDVGRKINIHLKVDTGMGRLGILKDDLPSFLKDLKSLKGIELEGVLSHFSEAEDEDKGYSLEQLDRFRGAIDIIRSYGFNPAYIHIANSAAIIDIPSSLFNLVRPGIMLYGSYPSKSLKKKINLKPVMTLVTEIIQLKRLGKGFPISYGRKFITGRESLIATIPIGYGDGYPRSLSNIGKVLVRRRRCPVVGRVCMDFTMIDVTDIPGVEVGDEVVLIGSQGDEEIRVEEVAEWADTISYEIFCGISSRVPREYM